MLINGQLGNSQQISDYQYLEHNSLLYWSIKRGGYLYRTRMVLSKDRFDKSHDGDDESSMKYITFACWLWSSDLGYGMHEDPLTLYVVFTMDCSQLVNMVLTPDEWPAFSTHMEEFWHSKTFFSNFKIRHIPRAQNKIAYKLARDAKSSLLVMLYIDSSLPVWLC